MRKERSGGKSPEGAEIEAFSRTSNDPMWSPPPRSPELEAHQVHVWRVRLEGEPGDAPHLTWHTSVISEEELRTAGRHHLTRHRALFVLRRAFLRRVLARYTGAPPETLVFETTRYGKPELLEHGRTGALSFSLSHSGGMVVLAVARSRMTGRSTGRRTGPRRGRRMGIDIEGLERRADAEAVLERFFLPGDREAFEAIPESQRTEFFLRLWTGAEALVKAQGLTIAHGLPDARLSGRIREWMGSETMGDRPSRRCGFHAVLEDAGGPGWILTSLDVYPGSICTLCVERTADAHPNVILYDFETL